MSLTDKQIAELQTHADAYTEKGKVSFKAANKIIGCLPALLGMLAEKDAEIERARTGQADMQRLHHRAYEECESLRAELQQANERVAELGLFIKRVSQQPDWFNHCDNDDHDERCHCLNDAAQKLLEPRP